MEDKETGKDMQDTLENDLTKTELKGEDHLPLSPLEEEQIPGDNVQLGDPDDKEEESPSENVELQTANKEHYPIQDAELRMEGPDDNGRENPGIMMELQKEDPKENRSEDEGLQSEDPDVTKEQNPSENVELPLEGPDDKGSLSPDEKEQNPSETVKLPIDDHGLVETAVSETAADANIDGNANGVHGNNETDGSNVDQLESGMPHERSSNTKSNHDEKGDEYNDGVSGMELCSDRGIKEEVSNPKLDEIKVEETKPKLDEIKDELSKPELDVVKKELSKPGLGVGRVVNTKSPNQSFLSEPLAVDGDESGTEEEQAAFMKELETFFKESSLEFKPPKFYGEGLNLLKLWRAVTRLGGYEQVTSCKLWRQVGESFKPPKTCTTVSWTFRCFYEKALLEYEKHKMRGGELPLPDASLTEPISIGHQAGGNQASGSGRARRDAAARAMQGWHSQRLLGNGEVGDPIIKDKNSSSTPKREKHLKSIGLLKRKRPSSVERAVKVARMKATKPQLDTMVVDVGPPADWVKINVRKTKDCFEVYALVPGLLREEVRVQSDPAGRLVISGEPEQLDNPWGVTPFKKVVSLPSRIDPHQTSAVVTLHGQLFVRVPFEQSDL